MQPPAIFNLQYSIFNSPFPIDLLPNFPITRSRVRPCHDVPPMPPTRVRGRVLLFAFLLTVITYLDRVCISAAAPSIMNDLGITFVEMSVAFSAFTLAYSL